MLQNEMIKLAEDTFSHIDSLLKKKGYEYSGVQDALSNFKRNAERVGVSPFVIWHVYAAKHYDSISAYIKDKQNGVIRELAEPIEGRIDDLITYLVILKGLIKECGNMNVN